MSLNLDSSKILAFVHAINRKMFDQSAESSSRWRMGFVLVGIMGLFCCAGVVYAFASYPLETEYREGSFWLHHLASRAGIDIYDYSKVAFINMNHGPLNAPLKSMVCSLIGLENSHWVSRVFVIAFPITLLLGSIAFIRRRQDLLPAIFLGISTYLVLVTHRDGTAILNGRSDALAHTLAVLFVLLIWTNVCAFNTTVQIASASAAGVIAATMYLTNWRSVPFAAFCLVVWFGYRSSSGKKRDGLVMVLSFLVMVAVTIGIVLNFDFQKFYLHFYAFFNPSYGWGASTIPPLVVVRRLITFLPQFLIISLALFLLHRFKFDQLGNTFQQKIWFYGLLILSAVLCAGFIANSGGGYLAYMNFSFLGIWFLGGVVLNSSDVDRYGKIMSFSMVALSIALMSGILYLSPMWMYMFTSRERATRLIGLLRAADERYSIVSEDVFFFRKKYNGEVIDMGDVVSAVVARNRFPAEFIEKAKSHFASVASNHPDLIVTDGFCSSELKALIIKEYEAIYIDPLAKGALPWGVEKMPIFRVYARNNLPKSELLMEFEKLK